MPGATHFVAFQVKDEEILQHLDQVISEIKHQDPDVGTSAVVVSRSHVSLFVLEIEPDAKAAAVEMFKRAAEAARHDFRTHPLELTLEKVEKMTISGGNKLLYVNVAQKAGPKSQIPALIRELKEALEKVKGVHLEKNRSPFLHVSLINTMIGGKGPKDIPTELYKEKWGEFAFGVQKVASVQLLSRSKEGSYYHVEAEVSLK